MSWKAIRKCVWFDVQVVLDFLPDDVGCFHRVPVLFPPGPLTIVLRLWPCSCPEANHVSRLTELSQHKKLILTWRQIYTGAIVRPAFSQGADVVAASDPLLQCNVKKFVGRVGKWDHEKGYGFIECEDTYQLYQRNVFLHKAHFVDGLVVGDTVNFHVELNDKGWPQARALCKQEPLEEAVPTNSAGLPLRPQVGTCSYYAAHGRCRFGMGCRWNHPELEEMQTHQGPQAVTPPPPQQLDWVCSRCGDYQFARNVACRICGTPPVSADGAPVFVAKRPIACKFHLAGFCKLGETCSFQHPAAQPGGAAEAAATEQGRPVPTVVKRSIPCRFFLQGYCRLGTGCDYLHPQGAHGAPAVAQGVPPAQSVPQGPAQTLPRLPVVVTGPAHRAAQVQTVILQPRAAAAAPRGVHCLGAPPAQSPPVVFVTPPPPPAPPPAALPPCAPAAPAP
ncbi:unnamed protein product, partial [Prorocentrum cordatum]